MLCNGSLYLNLVALAAAAFISACQAYFLDFCFEEGNIFQAWLPWVARRLLRNKISENQNAKNTQTREDLLDLTAVKCFWFKPLGGCVICSHIWQAAVLWPAFVYIFSLPPSWLLFYLLVGNFMLRKMLD